MKLRCQIAILAALGPAAGCQSSGVGDPCVPEVEYQRFFSGYEVSEVEFETRSFQCETRLCLVNHFQGRASCPYGQSLANGAAPRCHIPGSSDPSAAIEVDVRPQLTNRRAVDTVYCSCRCNGTDPLGRYCRCPAGFQCAELLRDIGVGSAELAGSYCVKEGTVYDTAAGGECDIAKRNCGVEDGR